MYLVKNRIKISKGFAATIFGLLLTSTHSWSDTSLIDSSMEFMGLALITIGTFGRIWSYLYICGRKINELVVVGPYSISRNPLYVFSLIAATGVGLASENILILGLIILFFSIMYPIVIRAEEKELARMHGNAFQKYKHAVPCFFPRSLIIHQPERYYVHTNLFGRVFFDAMWFVWIYYYGNH